MDHLPPILCHTIPHKAQSYNTAGNYWENGVWHIRLSKMDKWQYEALLLLHEIVEMVTTRNDGVSWESIDQWDKNEGKDSDDPGMMPDAPYHRQHLRAVQVEKLVASFLGIDWDEYDKSYEKLEYRDDIK